MKRSHAIVVAVSAALAVVVVAGVAFSLLVLDRRREEPPPVAASDSSLLVVTWGPSLCTVEPSNPGCRSGHVARLGRVFLLHGLWPQPSTQQYCDVRRDQRRGRKQESRVALPPDLQSDLQTVMSDSAIMTSHEWSAHGTCSGVAAPDYFRIAATLMQQASDVLDPVFTRAAGQTLSSRAVRDSVEAAFGPGAGKRVGLTCRDAAGPGSVVYEVRFSLPPVTDLYAAGGALSLGKQLAGAPTVGPGCGRALVP